MRTIEKQIFQFEELSDEAKERARNWYRDGDEFDPCFEPFETAAKLLGITFETRDVPLMSGKTRQESDIHYSIAYAQGDGASFAGSYEFAKGCAQAVRKEFPTDTALHSIADGLTVLYTRYYLAYGIQLTATIEHKRDWMEVTVDDLDEEIGVKDEDAGELRDLMYSFADWIYKSLRDDLEYQNSDETVDDNITANEYEFTEDGERA